MNRQPYCTPPRWWGPMLSPRFIRLTCGMRRNRIRKLVKFSKITMEGFEKVQQLVRDNCGVMITANHSAHYDSEAFYCGLDQFKQPLFIVTAWQIFGGLSWWKRYLLQGMGCFSINREGSDRNAFKESVRVLREEPHPLLIFPEGDIYHTNDRITSFREGMSAIAMSAARHGDRPIAIVPCGIKFWYIDDPRPSLRQVLTKMESRLLLHPAEKWTLVMRIQRLATAAISLKEIEFMGHLTHDDLSCRVNRLIDFILQRLEQRHGSQRTDVHIPERVKTLRQLVIKKIDEGEALRDQADEALLHRYRLDIDDLFTVMQLYSYPVDYLDGDPSIERIAETIDKLEEDITFAVLPTVHGRKHVQLRFGDPIEVTSNRSRDLVTVLANQARDGVQAMIDQIDRDRANSQERLVC